MSETKKKTNVIRNPSPEEIESNLLGGSVEAETEEENVEEKEKEALIKDDESMFSPEKHLHKLICGNHNYNSDSITDKGEIYIRRYTTFEESIFQELDENSSLLDLFTVITKTFQTAIRSTFDPYKLFMNEQLNLFIHILALTYGEEMKINLRCIECDKEHEVSINLLKDIPITYMKKKDKIPVKIKLESYGTDLTLYLHYPTLEEQGVYLSNSPSTFSAKTRLLVDNMEGMLPNNKEVEEKYWEEIMNNLNKDDRKKIKEAIEYIAEFGIQIDNVDGFSCGNKSCEMYNKPQKTMITIEDLLFNLINQ